MAITPLQQLQNEATLISQGKVNEAVASSQSYNSPAISVPVASTPVPDPFAIAPTGGYQNPSLAASTNKSLPIAKQDKKIATRVAPPYTRRTLTRNLSAEQKALSSILASSSIKDGTDVNSLSNATKQLLQENINLQVYGTAKPVFAAPTSQTSTNVPSASPPPTPVPTSPLPTAPISRPILDLSATSPLATQPTGFLTEEPEAPRSLADIRLETLAQAQAVIDATEAYFQSSLSNIRQAGQANLAQTSSIAVGAGLAGSPFQTTMESNQIAATNAALNEVSAQRSSEVATILASAETQAQNIYQQGVQNFQEDRGFYASERDKQLAYSDKLIAEAKKLGNETLINIASSGYSLDEMPAGEYQKLLDNTGMSDFEAKAIWAAHTPEANASFSTQNNHLVMTYFDPVTRKPVVTAIPLPPELIETPELEPIDYDIKSITLGDGSVILYDANNPYDENGKLKTITYAGSDIRRTYAPRSGGGGGGGSGGSGISNYSQLLATLNASKGSDGYVNTDVYKGLRSEQKDKTGFDKNFAYLLNPNDPSASAFKSNNLSSSTISPTVLKNLGEDIIAGQYDPNLYQMLINAYPGVSASFIASEMQRLGVY